MEELIKKYPMILSIQMISEASFAPMIIIKLKNSEDIIKIKKIRSRGSYFVSRSY